MRIWTIKIGEPLPDPNVRLMRTGIVTKAFAARGADVTWWVSTFSHNHPTREYVADQGEVRKAMGNVTLRFVHGPPYHKNVSFARIRNHRALAADFSKLARTLPKPDLIFCAYPPIEIADEATRFGAEFGIPVILDIRDLWPDVFLDITPVPRPLMRVALTPWYVRARQTLARATALTAITDPILNVGLNLAGRPRHTGDRVFCHAYERPQISEAERQTAAQFWRQHGLELGGNEKIACFFGNLSTAPDLDTPVEALSHLSGKLEQNLKMVLCGSGDRVAWLREQAQQHPQLVVPGRVGQAEISVLMEHAHLGLLIYPNRPDLALSFPNKFGEYLSGSLPILSTLDGLSGTFLREKALGATSPSGEPRKFALEIEALISDDARHQAMVRAANQVFSDEFDASRVYGAMVDHLLTFRKDQPDTRALAG